MSTQQQQGTSTPTPSRDGNFVGHLYRQSSEYFRSRASVAIVQETRGVPYKIFSQIIFIFLLIFGLRDMFWCGQPFTSDPNEARLLSIFADCNEDPVQQIYSTFSGGCILLQGCVRFVIATTVSTAELFHAVLMATLYDLLLVYIVVRAGMIPMLYTGILTFMVVYESYILWVAHRVHSSRRKMRKINDTNIRKE